MPARSIGPLYGDIPELDASWAVAGTYTADEMRELIRAMQEIKTSYANLRQLTLAMNSAADLSAAAVSTIKSDIAAHAELIAKIETAQENIPADLSPDKLPLVKADVVSYSEEPLKARANYMATVLQPAQERAARLVMKVCLALDLCTFGVDDAPCCKGPNGMTSLQRS